MKTSGQFSKIPPYFGRIHFIGMGGIGMSGIAELLCNMGYNVSGSDLARNANIDRLIEFGVRFDEGHHAHNVQGAGVVVISSAIPSDNVELVAARNAAIPIVKRADMLAELMRFKRAIAVAGTHGKTTTTALVGQLLVSAGYDPTIINGGILNAHGTNALLGAGDWLVAEADESDGSFLKLPADIAIITNIDPEHMEHYGSFDKLISSFRQFAESIPFYGFNVLCVDHPVVKKLADDLQDRRVITYGLDEGAMIRASNLSIQDRKQYFDVEINDPMIGLNLTLNSIVLPLAGRHNVQNALAAIGVAYGIGIPVAKIKDGLSEAKGVKRRFTTVGEVNGVTIIDDYAHHPVEIKAVLDTARSLNPNRIHVVAQPHRYSRLHDLMEEFATCFNQADRLLIAPVYAAGEAPMKGVSSAALRDRILASNKNLEVDLLEDEQALAKMLHPHLQSGDMVLCMGAGSITKWAYALPDALQALADKADRDDK